MHAHTGTEVPIDMVKLSVQVLQGLNSTWCNVTSNSYNGTTVCHDDEMSSMLMPLLTFAAVLMLLLAFFLILSSLLRLFLGRQVLNLGLGGYNLYPMLRMMLRVTFVVFLPVLSSVLAHTKGDGGCRSWSWSRSGSSTKILLVLLWLLLVELIRKKVQVMDLPTDGSSFTRGIGRFTIMDYSTEVGHLTWTGYLVYTNIKDEKALMKAIFVILWSISLAKMLQRGFNIWMSSRSWHTARNPLLIAGYMQHVMDEQNKKEQLHSDSAASATASTSASSGTTIMEMCEFVVAKEHKLVPKEKKTLCCFGGPGDEKHDNLAKTKEHKLVSKEKGTLYCIGGPHNQKHVGVYMDLTQASRLVTVGKIWRSHGDPLFTNSNRRTYLEDLCLSFSLFKLLRRKFEQYPMVEVGSSMGRLMMKGLLNLRKDDGSGSDRPFRVLQLELEFLEAYYQAADPVVMSSPLLFFLNFALFMLLVPIYLVAFVEILIINNDAASLYCAAMGWSANLSKFPFLYVSITLALLATVICIEASEFFTSYLLANWNTVRIVCSYINLLPNRQWLRRKFLYYFVAFRFLVHFVLQFLAKNVFRRGVDDINMNQVSIIESCWPIHLLYKHTSQATLGTKAKEYIIQSMKELINMETGHISLQLPRFALATMFSDESTSTRRTKCTTEIILVCHLATELYKIEDQNKKSRSHKDGGRNQTTTNVEVSRDVATKLSRYCMYLVERMPTLLPDDETWVSERAGEMRNCLARVLQQCRSGCMICTRTHSCKHTMADSLREVREQKNLEDRPTLDAVKLLDEIQGWDELARFWINLLIYLAPSDNIQAHAKAVASSGGDLIVYLWAFCTHAGITRLPLDTGDDHSV